jgi:stage V sporulation protein SpoVS
MPASQNKFITWMGIAVVVIGLIAGIITLRLTEIQPATEKPQSEPVLANTPKTIEERYQALTEDTQYDENTTLEFKILYRCFKEKSINTALSLQTIKDACYDVMNHPTPAQQKELAKEAKAYQAEVEQGYQERLRLEAINKAQVKELSIENERVAREVAREKEKAIQINEPKPHMLKIVADSNPNNLSMFINIILMDSNGQEIAATGTVKLNMILNGNTIYNQITHVTPSDFTQVTRGIGALKRDELSYSAERELDTAQVSGRFGTIVATFYSALYGVFRAKASVLFP